MFDRAKNRNKATDGGDSVGGGGGQCWVKNIQSWLEWLDVGVVRWGGGGECKMLKESEGQGSRLKGERQGGRQRKTRQSGEG